MVCDGLPKRGDRQGRTKRGGRKITLRNRAPKCPAIERKSRSFAAGRKGRTCCNSRVIGEKGKERERYKKGKLLCHLITYMPLKKGASSARSIRGGTLRGKKVHIVKDVQTRRSHLPGRCREYGKVLRHVHVQAPRGDVAHSTA